MITLRHWISILLFTLSFNTFSQGIKDTSIFIPMFRINYALLVPGGDLADRFGANSSVSFSFLAKTKSNILIGYDYSGMFGNQVKEDEILDHIKTNDGEIINQLGKYADIVISERGFYTGPQFGYLYSFKKPNPNSGIYIMLSGGLLQHKIKIQNKNEDSPQILGEYIKGYDRLTNGFALKETIAYLHFDNKSIINFYAGFEFYQGWTQSRRDFDYYLMTKDTKKRLDLMFGIKLGWIITFHKKMADIYYYY